MKTSMKCKVAAALTALTLMTAGSTAMISNACVEGCNLFESSLKRPYPKSENPYEDVSMIHSASGYDELELVDQGVRINVGRDLYPDFGWR